MRIVPYLTFDGDCEAAFRFYEECLRGRIEAMVTHPHPGAADHLAAESPPRILHARLAVGAQRVLGCDSPPGRYHPPAGIHVALHVGDAAEAERIFGALLAGGTVTVPIAPTFWSERFGMGTDRFGIHWMVSCDSAAPDTAA